MRQKPRRVSTDTKKIYKIGIQKSKLSPKLNKITFFSQLNMYYASLNCPDKYQFFIKTCIPMKDERIRSMYVCI